MMDCKDCPKRLWCVMACEEANRALCEVDRQLEEEEAMENAWRRDQYYPQQQARRMRSALMAFHAFAVLFVALAIGQCAAYLTEEGKPEVNLTEHLTDDQRREIVGRWQHEVFPGRLR